MTPVSKDNFGWTNADTILYLSILMAAGGIIAILWDEFCPSQARGIKNKSLKIRYNFSLALAVIGQNNTQQFRSNRATL